MNCPVSWEPSGYDFLSPCLQEAALMKRVLSLEKFKTWFESFLPELKNRNYTLAVAEVSDRKDGKLVHLDGVNFSRAWCLFTIVKDIPAYKHLKVIANQHIQYSLPNLVDDSYEGGHWLGSFAIYALNTSKMIKNYLKNIGPGTLVAAAFIGPGTVTLCTIAGVEYGFSLLWTMILSILATIVLQEMAARLGVVSQKGLSEVIRSEIKNPTMNKVLIFLILSAIVIGNASYEAGNISGGILGLETILGELRVDLGSYDLNILTLLVGIGAFILLYIGSYKFLERVLIVLVLLMSLSFLITSIVTQPDVLNILRGALIPKSPEGEFADYHWFDRNNSGTL